MRRRNKLFVLNDLKPEEIFTWIIQMNYKITEEECRKMIFGVCSGCGGELVPIETVDNSDDPTFWSGCKTCCEFNNGVDKKIWQIARNIVNQGEIYYSHLQRSRYEDNEARLDYWKRQQTKGMINLVIKIIKELELFNIK